MELSKLLVLFFVVVSSSRVDAATFSTMTYPEPDYENRTVIILPEEENATVTFQCIAIQDGGERFTAWFLQRYGASETELESILDLPQFVRNGSLFQNLTIVNVTSDLDRAQVWCGPGVGQVEPRFLLGFEVAAQLDSTGVISPREGDELLVSLEAESNSPFSPLVTFQWMYNGATLNSSQRILLNGYNITIMDLQRGDAGEYQLNVTNSAGFGVGNFTLDVQFGPDATDVSVSPLYFVADTSITLTAFTNIEGNPEPSSTWTLNSTAINSTADIRFNTSVPGQLSITNISSADAGTYTCTLDNGEVVSATIELRLAELPTMPENVMANEVNATSATLMWDAPSFQGIFTIDFYRVRLVPSPSNKVIETNMTQTFVSGLFPGFEYSFTVAAVFTDPLSQKELEVESSSVLFNTSVTAPVFEVVNVVNEEGFIRVYWTLLYTGGLDTTVQSVCNIDDGGSASASGYDSMSVLSGTEMIAGNSKSPMGNMSLGPVQAGATYVCEVTAYNSNGTDVEERPDLTSEIGIPSAPTILDSMVLPGVVVLTVETTSPGGQVVNFNVTIREEGSSEVGTVQQFIITDYDPNEGAVLHVNVPTGGSFSFSVLSFNSFGSLEVEDYVNVTDVPRAPSTSSTPGIVTSTPSQPPTATSPGEAATTATPTEAPAGGLSGGEVAGIVIAILIIAALIFLIVLVVVYLYIRNRGESYQVDKPQSKSTVKMAEVEVDIGTELDTHPPEEPEKQKPNEVQYADLDHFRKKEQTPDDTTPLAASSAANPALEPVMYSVIQPQPVKTENTENGSQPNATDGADATSI